ncbi:uncharacterized protein LOC141648704 [Silene latifolia]|uniref:uncharacterized protein LOC141648704 n=1 Tax=Silene latifolia TaxID=37657 RepID=UPI003D77BAAD
MTRSLKSRRKFGFIDGSITKPTDQFGLDNWVVVNCTLCQWIMNTIDPSLLDSISYAEVASVYWAELANTFSVVDGTKIHNLKTQLHECKQTKGMDVSTYFGKLKSLWDSIVVHEPPFDYKCGKCECTINQAAIQRLDNERLHQFFMGHDPILYANVRSQQFQLDPLPSLNRAYQVILQEERLRAPAATRVDASEVMAFAIPGDSRSSVDCGMSSWIIDTGASNHVTGNLTYLDPPRKIPSRTVGLPNGQRVVSTIMGSMFINKSLILHDAHSTRTTIGVGELQDGFYWICAGVKELVVHSFYKSVQFVQSDNGNEFNNMADYFFHHGIHFQTSCVGTPQQNGRVERKHRHILNVARALPFQADLPNIKYKADSTIERYKSHLVVFDNHQVEDLDYGETFAPVAKMFTIRAFLTVAAMNKWELHQILVWSPSSTSVLDLGPLKYFLGLEVARSTEGIYLSQRKYALNIISETGLLGVKPAVTPIEQNHKLSLATGPILENIDSYSRLVGHLVYLAITRPDLSYAGSPGQGILLRSDGDFSITDYELWTDAVQNGLNAKNKLGFVEEIVKKSVVNEGEEESL